MTDKDKMLSEIMWRARLMVEGDDEPVEPEDLRELAALILALAQVIDCPTESEDQAT